MNYVADITLYGQRRRAGWIAMTTDGDLIGDGEPTRGRTFATAIFLACNAIRYAGHLAGRVRVFDASGLMMAETNVSRPDHYDSLIWEPTMQFAMTTQEIVGVSL